MSTVTALVPLLGYERAATLAKQALAEGRTVRELALATGLLTAEQLEQIHHCPVYAACRGGKQRPSGVSGTLDALRWGVAKW